MIKTICSLIISTDLLLMKIIYIFKLVLEEKKNACHCEYDLAFAMISNISIKFNIKIDMKLFSLTFETNFYFYRRLNFWLKQREKY